MSAAAIVSIVAAVLAGAAMTVTLIALRRARARMRTLDLEIERGKATFDEVIARESEMRAAELASTLAIARAEALSVLAEEERRITEERRRDVAERERDATTKLSAALTEAQRAVEQRFADWGSDLSQLQQSLAGELERISQRQAQLTVDLEAKVVAEADRLQTELDEHRGLITRVREDLARMVEEVAKAAVADLESHSAERRRALHEVAERLRRRERELQEQIDREQAEAIQRVGTQLQGVEHRQLEQLRRVVTREAQRGAEAAAAQFDNTIRSSREEAARRLGRELDLAVDRFAREAEAVLAERVDSDLRNVEGRLQELARRVEALTART